MIDSYTTPCVDYRGKPSKRLHRTCPTYENDKQIIADIENY
jgi:hypothetical protein